ncbi:MAG: LLM class flavin-dependent oxidoreductase [Anaerolineae bacterium]|nr:LLM class flavin-dependent oxidoreductase [Anaerolineae bacterium]
MKYGIYLPNFGPYGDARVLAGLAQDAEKAGWDGFFLWDHIAGWKLPIVDVWVALAAIAMHTKRIRIGTTVTPLPRRRPWKVARETVSLDHLSGGRLILSVGIGLGEDEWDHLGEETDPKRRGAMLDEALDILVGLWTGELFSYAGQHYTVQDAHFLPRPVQQPRIPIWVGGFWPNKAPFRRAAKWDGVFPLFLEAEGEGQELAQLEEALSYINAQRPSEQPQDIVCMGITPGDEAEQATDMVRKRADLGATWWLELIAPFRFGKGFEDEWPVKALRERILQGPPQVGRTS